MYIPKFNEVTDKPKLFDFIHANSFATLVSNSVAGPFASHLPLMLDASRGANGFLIGHMARANSQWNSIIGDVLAIFHGPHAYISPTWYGESGYVPTWNYAVVHAVGKLTLIEDKSRTAKIVEDLTAVYESGMPSPWTVDKGEKFQVLLNGIVGFEIEITKLEGKWKLSQNHTVERRTRVVTALEQSCDENSRAIAELMRQIPSGK
jgi:transcriptional regulator